MEVSLAHVEGIRLGEGGGGFSCYLWCSPSDGEKVPTLEDEVEDVGLLIQGLVRGCHVVKQNCQEV